MIIMNIEMNNIYEFCNFKANFSYPKKIVNSTIKGEYLKSKKNFRYKKVNVIMGSNASGKTTFGKTILNILNFIDKKNSLYLDRMVIYKDKESSFSMDFVVDEDYLYRLSCSYMYDDEDSIKLDVYKSKILSNDSYEKSSKRFESIDKNNEMTNKEKLNVLNNNLGCFFELTDEGFESYSGHVEIDILEKILQTLDDTIIKVDKITETDDAYIIRKKGDLDIIIQDYEMINGDVLSSGTKAGIGVAYILSAIKNNKNGFYFSDEKFSFIHSDIEKSILSLMIEMLHENTQLFFTTHNKDILNMGLPKHSFMFLRKRECIDVVYPSDYIKKNEQSLLLAVENDIFDISPNLEKIYTLCNNEGSNDEK